MLNFALPASFASVTAAVLTDSVVAALPRPAAPGAAASLLTSAHLAYDECYPYLVRAFSPNNPAHHFDFTRRAWKLRDPAQLAAAEQRAAVPTLRYVKDNAVIDIDIPLMKTKAFLSRRCLRLRTDRGLFTLSKRLSRILRPFRYFAFFDASTVEVYCDPEHGEDTAWDGMSLVSAEFVRRVVFTGQWRSQFPDVEMLRQKQRALLSATRLELTMMTADGQVKGHALVVDELPDGVDVWTNDQNVKAELSQHDGQTFVGLDIVHGKAEADIDKQSLINLVPFLDCDWLLDNLRRETETLLADLESYKPDLADAVSASASPLHQFLAAGGDPRCYPGIRKMQYRGRYEQLRHYTYPDLRLPGFQRWYICNDVNVGLSLPQGTYLLKPEWDSVVVNADDWRAYIADVLGGADMDDAVLIHRFVDTVDGEEKAILWRQPNQAGEAIILRPVAVADDTTPLPRNNSHLLPTRIDLQPKPQLSAGVHSESETVSLPKKYTTEAMTTALRAAASNDGILGSFCNLLMVAVAVYGVAPRTAPIRLETIIDASVKSGEDISWVRDWIAAAAVTMVRHRPIPRYLHGKVYGLLRDVAAEQRPRIRTATGHWIDALQTQIGLHVEDYRIAMEKAVAVVAPPVALLRLAMDDATGIGERLHSCFETTYQAEYQTACEQLTVQAAGLSEDIRRKLAHEHAGRRAQAALLSQLREADDADCGVLFLLAYAYLHGRSDRAVWNKSVTPIAVRALGERHLLAPGDGRSMISAEVHHVWYNLKYANIPAEIRPKMNAADRTADILGKVAQVARRVTEIVVADGRRVLSGRTGNLMGVLPKTHGLNDGAYTVQLAQSTAQGDLRLWLHPIDGS